jgi:type IV secretory pathway VirB10-like protein
MTLRPRTRRLAALAIATVAAVYVSGAAGQWAWKEDSGRVVYSDRPPPANIKSTQILRQPAVAAPTPAPQPAAPGGAAADGERPAPSPAASSGPKSIAERDMEFRKRQQERADSERKAQEEQQKAAAKAAECERSRGYLRSLEDGIRIARTDASGNREILDEAQRAAEMERTRKSIQQLCN